MQAVGARTYRPPPSLLRTGLPVAWHRPPLARISILQTTQRNMRSISHAEHESSASIAGTQRMQMLILNAD